MCIFPRIPLFLYNLKTRNFKVWIFLYSGFYGWYQHRIFQGAAESSAFMDGIWDLKVSHKKPTACQGSWKKCSPVVLISFWHTATINMDRKITFFMKHAPFLKSEKRFSWLFLQKIELWLRGQKLCATGL